MKTKINILTGFLIVFLIACQDEVLDTSINSSHNESQSRSSMGVDCDLFISYQKKTRSYLTSPDDEDLDDCIYDIVSNSTEVVKQAIETCLRKDSQPCIKIRDITSKSSTRDRGSNDDDDYSIPHIQEMEFCNGQSVVTTSDGQTTTYESEINHKQTLYMFSSLMMTQEEIDSTMAVFIHGLDMQEAQYEITGNYLTLTETLDDGTIMSVLYDIKSGVVIGETLTDETGAIIWSKSNAFTCTDDGRLIIDFSKTLEVLTSYYCDKTINRTEITEYSNYSIN